MSQNRAEWKYFARREIATELASRSNVRTYQTFLYSNIQPDFFTQLTGRQAPTTKPTMNATPESISVARADLNNALHQQAVLMMTNHYACDELAGGKPLPDEVLNRLVDGLKRHPTTLIFLAWLGEQPVGIATCFLGFSTFAAKPLINIHDLAVHENHRGQGIGRRLLSAVEEEAQRLGCVKLTLEVLQNNTTATKLYESFGFEHASYSPTSGGALFFAKPLRT